MTAVMALLNLFRRIPRGGWLALATLALVAGAGYGVRAGIRHIQAGERARVLAEGAAVDQVALRWQREAYERQLDSVRGVAARLRDSVQAGVRTVYRWTPLIPDSLRKKYAAVDSLVRACTRLAQDCDSLRVATARIDTLIDTVTVIDTKRIKALELAVVHRDGRILDLEARTCRVPTAVSGGLGALAGYFVGRKR